MVQNARNNCNYQSWRNILFYWHIMSMFLLILAVSYTPVNSANTDENIGSTGPVTHTASVTDVSSEGPEWTRDNSSDTPDAADCLVDPSVCVDVACNHLNSGFCLNCTFDEHCQYGSKQTAKCKPRTGVNCSGNKAEEFSREYECRYCYQLPEADVWCNQSTSCALNRPHTHYPAHPTFVSTCWAKPGILCLGRRCFHKQIPCNWSKGYKWSTTMLLSIFLGGFGADRFYLGLWREGIGKLLSFGGLGVWTLVDVILIGVGYIGPHDGSVYL